MTVPILPVGDRRSPRSLGVRPLGDAPVCIVDPERYGDELALRRRLLDADHGARFGALPGSEDGRAGVLALVAADLGRQGIAVPPAPPGADPLDWAGRHAVEDLLLLDAGREEVPLVAGSLCFPNGWTLRGALGHSVTRIHAPVPGFAEAMGAATLALMRRLRPERPVWRANWTLRTTAALDLSPGVALPPPPDDPGDLMVRVERQTLSRLHGSTGVLFTVHTRSRPLSEVAAEPVRARRLHRAISSMGPSMREYKDIAALAGPALGYLEGRRAASS